MRDSTDHLTPDQPAMRAMLADLFRPYQGSGLTGHQLEICAIWRDKAAGRGPLARHFSADELVAAVAWLAERNREGWNAYVGAGLRHRAPARGRATRQHVVQSRWLWADFDAEGAADAARDQLAALDFSPSFWVCTGTAPFERWHAWWELSDAMSTSGVAAAMRRLVAALGADPAPKAPSGLMRIAGGIAWAKAEKPGRINQLVTRHPGSGRVYGEDEVNARLDLLDPPKPKAAPAPARGRVAVASPASSEQLAELLRWIDPAPLHYDDWLRVGMALHDAGEPIDTWESWSARSPKHDDADMQRRWDSASRIPAPSA